MKDLIRRSDAIAILEDLQNKHLQFCLIPFRIAIEKMQAIPSADRPQGVYDAIALVNRETEREDLSEEIKNYLFCDLRKKLWGLDSRPQGEWIDAEIPLESGGSMPIQVCNLCKTFYPLAYTGGGHRFCPNCGARMKGVDDEDN